MCRPGPPSMHTANSPAQRALQRAIALRQAFGAQQGEPLSVRIGINAGEPIAEESDPFGSSVIAAARIAAQGGVGRHVRRSGHRASFGAKLHS